MGFYSNVEPNSYAYATRLFLIGKIFINVRILPNPPRIRILFILGFYRLGLFMRHKLFPFRISWRPHNDQFSATWPFNPSTLVCSHRIRLLLAHLFGSVISKFLPFHSLLKAIKINRLNLKQNKQSHKKLPIIKLKKKKPILSKTNNLVFKKVLNKNF